ncbi:MAG: hypothetical protein H8E37_06315 [Planctomycetes bacterium]|nr:hypothetical protein [Planctomycetota bacterium]
MNKAFVREPDEIRDRCPDCGSAGIPVFEATLQVWLQPDEKGNLSSSAFFCSHETCRIAFFDAFERTISADEIATPFWPKDRNAPVCPCFGLTLQDIEEAVREDSVIRIRETIQRAGTDEAHCSTSSPSGQSCVASIQKCYMQLRSG